MANTAIKLRLLFLTALVVATSVGCDDEVDQEFNGSRVECPLGLNCDRGAGNGCVLEQGAGGIDDTVSSSAPSIVGSEGIITDVAVIERCLGRVVEQAVIQRPNHDAFYCFAYI